MSISSNSENVKRTYTFSLEDLTHLAIMKAFSYKDYATILKEELSFKDQKEEVGMFLIRSQNSPM